MELVQCFVVHDLRWCFVDEGYGVAFTSDEVRVSVVWTMNSSVRASLRALVENV